MQLQAGLQSQVGNQQAHDSAKEVPVSTLGMLALASCAQESAHLSITLCTAAHSHQHCSVGAPADNAGMMRHCKCAQASIGDRRT